MSKQYRFGIGFLLLLVGLIFPVPILAQEATPEATQEAAQEVTPEATIEAMPEATMEPIVGRHNYELFVPSSYDDSQPTPLILALHGAGGSGAGLRKFIELDTVAEEAGYIVAYPDSYLTQNWAFSGRMTLADGSYIDDVEAIAALLDSLQADYNIDPERIYVMGHSNGASMGYKLVCEMPGTFAGLASVSAPLTWSTALGCLSAAPQTTSLLLIYGTHDAILSWKMSLNDDGDQLMSLSAVDTFRFWAASLGCDPGDVETEELPDVDSEDSSFVWRMDFSTCPDNTQAVFYAVLGGGHGWPGIPDQSDMLQPVNMDMDANQVILDWFTSLGQAD